MLSNDSTYDKVQKIKAWFVAEHKDFVADNSVISWAEKLGVKLNNQNSLDERELFKLFTLAVLWNNQPTFKTEKGIEAFKKIENKYTLENFRSAKIDPELKLELKTIGSEEFRNLCIFDLIEYIANGDNDKGRIWLQINNILKAERIGDLEADKNRLLQLHELFSHSEYARSAYLTVKVFLIFRELRIQFKKTGQYQYHPAICCIPDYHVISALQEIGLLKGFSKNIANQIHASEIVSHHFCNQTYDLYDLPLYFAHKDHFIEKMLEQERKDLE
jgi:hypothetical protein